MQRRKRHIDPRFKEEENRPIATREQEVVWLNERNQRIQELALEYGLELSEVYLRDFIGYVFERPGRLSKWDDEPFEDVQSPEYQFWLTQKKAHVADIDYKGNYRMWRYNPIVFYQDYVKGVKRNLHRILLKDDYQTLDFCESRQFAIMSPMTYVGRTRFAKNARYLYAFAIDLDGVGIKQLNDLFLQMNTPDPFRKSQNSLPLANLIVSSGHGLHLYYLLKEPIPLYEGVPEILRKLKYGLTHEVWNGYTSTLRKVQMQGIHQGFRLPGTLTKFGETIRAFRVADAPYYTVEDLNKYLNKENVLTAEELETTHTSLPFRTSTVTLAEAEKRWPEWYARKILEGNRLPKKWHIKRDLYDWWLRKVSDKTVKVVPGHRYFCLMILAVYAEKCDISYEELEKDAYGLLGLMDSYTNDEDNHFTEEDIKDALRAYNESYNTFPRNSVAYLSGLEVKENKRHNRPQNVHMKVMRTIRDTLCEIKGERWDKNNGRKKETFNSSDYAKKIIMWSRDNPGRSKLECAEELGVHVNTVTRWWNTYGQYAPKQMAVMEWKRNHPEGNKSECARDLNISRPTVSKYWK